MIDSPVESPEALLLRRQYAQQAAHAGDSLRAAVRRLSKDDRRLLRLRFRDSQSIANIARALDVDARPLYRRFERILRRLRSELELLRVTGDGASEWLGHCEAEIGGALDESGFYPAERRTSAGLLAAMTAESR